MSPQNYWKIMNVRLHQTYGLWVDFFILFVYNKIEFRLHNL